MASFWDEFKDLFKTDEQRKEERQSAIADALDAEKAVTAELAELDRQYRESLPDEPEPDLDGMFPEDPGYERVEYVPATDDEIAARARAETDFEKGEERRKAESAFAGAVRELDKKSEEAEKDLETELGELGELYDELRKRTENDVLKRGLARSSIRTSALSALDRARSGEEAASRAGYADRASDIAAELSVLRSEQEAALEQLDLKYAAELEERIAELTEERDETVRKVTEYNNKIADKEREYAMQREEDIADYLLKREQERLEREQKTREDEAKYGYTGEKQRNYAQRYDIALEFYTSLSPDIAADALAASPNMRYFLGNYYDKLMQTLKGEEGQKRYF